MKTGKSLQELAAEITRQKDTKKDYVADTRVVEMISGGADVALKVGNMEPMGINDIAHDQIAEHVKIPRT